MAEHSDRQITNNSNLYFTITPKNAPKEIYFNNIFVLAQDLNDPEYVFTYKLTKLLSKLTLLIEEYEKTNSNHNNKMIPILDIIDEQQQLYCFKSFFIETFFDKDEWGILFRDVMIIIGRLCNLHGRSLKMKYMQDVTPHYGPICCDDFGTGNLSVIPESYFEKMFEEINYTKVIPFNMGYCLRKNIKLPLKIKILVKLFGHDIAGEIAKYLYVICCK